MKTQGVCFFIFSEKAAFPHKRPALAAISRDSCSVERERGCKKRLMLKCVYPSKRFVCTQNLSHRLWGLSSFVFLWYRVYFRVNAVGE